ncbi:MAG TPA: hypothetical protein VHE81_23035, partial [Lacipirellulaceae bacterium]|nr:hypothetical protein [Lacipirellulaceae bacterium]
MLCVAFGISLFELGLPSWAQTGATTSLTRLPPAESPVETAQLLPTPALPQTVAPPQPIVPHASFRKVQIFPRSEGMGTQVDPVQSPNGETAIVISGGVNVVIQGLSSDNLPQALGPLGDIDIEADRVVIWGYDLASLSGSTRRGDEPLQIYMEGNIVFRQGDRTVFADRYFYDVPHQTGTVINAELLTPIPQQGLYQYPGLVRLRASALRQLDQSHFVAQDGLVTSSRLEDPGYALESDQILFQDLQQTVVDPVTGQPIVAHQRLARGTNDYIFLDGVPIFYW